VVTWDEEAWKFTVADCDRQLRDGEPRIEVLTASNPSMAPFGRAERDNKTPRRRDQIRIISMTMQPGEDLVVGKRLRDILNEAWKRAAAQRVAARGAGASPVRQALDASRAGPVSARPAL
jgi:L-seryl-tRNA(Ser) seleniumtransferase